MDMEQLIRDIVGQVVRELRARPELSEQPALPAPALPARPAWPRVRVLGERSEALVTRLLTQVGEAELVFDGEEKPLEAFTEAFERHILPELGCTTMAALATGNATDRQARKVLHLLLHGITVEVLDFAYHTYRETASGPLYRLYEAHEHTLAGFGLVACRARTPDAVRLWGELVTAAMVEQAATTGTKTLLVREDAKVTPLALDAVKNHNLHILKQL